MGAVFIPAFAMAAGILTGGSKLFEVMFTMMVYGILNEVPFVDFIGAIKESRDTGVAHLLLAITAGLVLLIFSGRKREVNHVHS